MSPATAGVGRVNGLQLGRGHTKGDTVVWLPQDRVLLSGDLVEFDAMLDRDRVMGETLEG